MDDRIEILIADDADHNRVFAEIYFDGRFLALINQEEGEENPVIELPGLGLDEEMVIRKVPIAVFRRGVELAMLRLFPGRGG